MNHPERLGKYQITGVLGEGAMGVVYRGFDPGIRRLVALKTIRRQGGDEGMDAAESAARFRNEAQAAGRLQHPGIVSVYDFGDDGHIAYIAMEFVEGQTLSKYLSHHVRFDDADIASIGAQLLDALQHAHEHGVWHRDVKPSNVILTPTGRVKIADFGIARTENSQLTMAHSVLGTPMYMAPEQFIGQAIDHRVDLYATGVLLYQLLAGRPPFAGPPEVLMYKVVNETPVPPSAHEGQARSDRFDAVVAAALAKDRNRRPASAAAFRQALGEALAHALPPAVSPAAVQALPEPEAFARTERLPTHHTGSIGSMGTAATPEHWDPAELARVEATLARHVGPMARVMVRRAARQARDLAGLYTQLGGQITDAHAREAFFGQSGGRTGGTGGTGGAGIAGRTGGTGSAGRAGSATGTGGAEFERTGFTGGASADGPEVSDAWVEQAQPVLARHVGPIAKMVLKRALQRTRRRHALCALLAESVAEDHRAPLLAELDRL